MRISYKYYTSGQDHIKTKLTLGPPYTQISYQEYMRAQAQEEFDPLIKYYHNPKLHALKRIHSSEDSNNPMCIIKEVIEGKIQSSKLLPHPTITQDWKEITKNQFVRIVKAQISLKECEYT